METSLKASFAQIFSCCPKILSCPKFERGGGAAQLPSPPGPVRLWRVQFVVFEKFTSAYLFQIAREKLCDYLFMKKLRDSFKISLIGSRHA